MKLNEYLIIAKAIGIICELCKASPDKCVDLLTGYLWDEEEAGSIKKEVKNG